MIAKRIVYKCWNCQSQNIVKNGHNACGSQQYWCKDCGTRGVLEPKRGYTGAQKEQILSAYQERSSMRGIQRTFGVSRLTLVAFVIGDRSETTCRQLWEQIPPAYQGRQSYSDFWEAYKNVFPAETHHCVGKGSRQTNHMERWYGTLRQSCARFVRKTLSFSKSDAMHNLVTRLFIIQYNLSLAT